MANRIFVSATALGYNLPRYYSPGKTVKREQTLAAFNTALAEEHPDARVTELYISGRDADDDYDTVGTYTWQAQVRTALDCTEDRAAEIGNTIAHMLFGQYGLGDSGELDDVEVLSA